MPADGSLAFWAFAAAVIVAGSAACSAFLIVVLRPLLVQYALAKPNARSAHQAPTPQGAGIAVIAATLLAAIVAVAVLGSMPRGFWFAVAAIVLIAIVGAADDIRSIPVVPRLLLQALAVAAILAALPDALRVFNWMPWWIERALMFVVGVWFVNLVNFMDGLDWMTVAEVVPVTAGLAIFGIFGELPGYATVVALALLGATLGFAPFNKPVAKLFLGDVGSLSIGLTMGWLLVLLAGQGHLAAALLLPLYYVVDATATLFIRMRRRASFWEAHDTHFYQRARKSGVGVLAITGRVFWVNVALAALAAGTLVARSRTADIVALVIGLLIVAALLRRFSSGASRQS